MGLSVAVNIRSERPGAVSDRHTPDGGRNAGVPILGTKRARVQPTVERAGLGQESGARRGQ